MSTELASISDLFAYHFMVNALIAGTLVAVTAASIGWFMVVRRQTFAGHTLSLIAFPGAAAAALAGAPAFVGYFGASAAGALALSAVSGRDEAGGLSHESAGVGAVQALALGCGFLFVSLYHGLLTDLGSLLFGTFLGVTNTQVWTLLAVTLASLATLAVIARPLLFASVDADVARADGVPVGALSAGFLLLLGLAVGATSQITGALLVFALLVTPAATAQIVTARPALGLVLSIAIGVLVTWAGLAIAYFSIYPVGFWVTSVSFGVYALVRAGRALER